MQLIGADPHNGSVLLVQLGGLECVLAVEYNVKVSLIVARNCCQLWSWKPGKRVQEQPVENEAGKVYEDWSRQRLPKALGEASTWRDDGINQGRDGQ